MKKLITLLLSAIICLQANAVCVATFSYTGSPYCHNAPNAAPTFTGGGVAGTFTSTPAGLSLNSASGVVALILSTPGTYTVTNTVLTNGGCIATASITIDPDPTFPSAGSSGNTCGITTATLIGNTPVVGTGVWALAYGGTAIIANPSSPTTTVSGLSPGVSNRFSWTISTPCFTYADTTSIVVNFPPTTSIAGPDQAFCGNGTICTMAANTPTVGSGYWSLIAGSGYITTPYSPTTTITSLGYGPNVFEWTISSPPCTASTDQVIITVNAAPTVAAAGPNQTVCATTATLAGNAAMIGTGVWTLISGGGNITTPASPTSGLTGLTPGANVFQWTISNPPCASSSSQVTVFSGGAPTISNAGPDQIVCGANAALSANAPSVGTGLWTLVSGSGTITSPASPATAVSGLGSGNNVFEWTISAPPCGTSSSQVTISPTPIGVPICLVTVDSLSSHNIVVWEKSGVLSSTLLFKIYREDVTNVYSYLSSVMFDSLSVYHDYAVNPNVTGKRYKIALLDSCYAESAQSPYHNTIWMNNLGNGILNWTPYLIEGQSNPVNQYRIYRDDFGTGNWVMIGTTAGTQLGYTDVSWALYPAANYKVEVLWSFTCTPARSALNTSWSNYTQHSVGVSETGLAGIVSVSPNPFTNQTTITFANEQKNTSVKVMNVLGECIQQLTTNNKQFTLDLSSFAKGIYFVRIEDENKNVVNKKIVKE